MRKCKASSAPTLSRRTSSSLWVGTALLLLTGVACGRRADLTTFSPSAGPARVDCLLDEKGRLAVTVTNQGKRDCKATTTEIVFASLPPVRLPTRPVGRGTSVSVFYPIPDVCFAPQCRFEVRVDAKDEVQEANEGNNSAAGLCRRPEPIDPKN